MAHNGNSTKSKSHRQRPTGRHASNRIAASDRHPRQTTGNTQHGNVDESRSDPRRNAALGHTQSRQPTQRHNRRNGRNQTLNPRHQITANTGNRTPAPRGNAEEPDGNRSDAEATHDQARDNYWNQARHPARSLRNPANTRQPGAYANGASKKAGGRNKPARQATLHRSNAEKDGNRLSNTVTDAATRPGQQRWLNGNGAALRSQRPRAHANGPNGFRAKPRRAGADERRPAHDRYYDDPESYILSHRQSPRHATAPKVRYKKPTGAPRPAVAPTTTESSRAQHEEPGVVRLQQTDNQPKAESPKP